MSKQLFSLFILCFCFTLGISQKPVTIKLDNPSFEDYPQAGHTPQGWYDCGFTNETPPDVQPNNAFKVSKIASHGTTYLGMVVRDINTWEAVGQRLKVPLGKGANYTFSLDLARSESYESQSQTTRKTVNYNTPVIIRIWAGSGYCAKTEMLDETEPVTNFSWQKFTFKFTPKANHTHFMIEAFYKVPTLFPYNGNVLMDNASDIVYEDDKKIVKVDAKNPTATVPKPSKSPKPPKATRNDTPNATIAETKPKDPVRETPKLEEPKFVEQAAKETTKFKEGQIMKIERLQFKPTSSVIEKESHSQLDKIYNLLLENPNLVVEIGGHTNLLVEDNMGLKLSTDRARSVAEYLASKGIESSRLVIKGYGKSRPLIKEISAAANKENQRVEIKILSTNG
jgi:outer membrane protein OmpA-like peptidoglycan-associated protein